MNVGGSPRVQLGLRGFYVAGFMDVDGISLGSPWDQLGFSLGSPWVVGGEKSFQPWRIDKVWGGAAGRLAIICIFTNLFCTIAKDYLRLLSK